MLVELFTKDVNQPVVVVQAFNPSTGEGGRDKWIPELKDSQGYIVFGGGEMLGTLESAGK